MSEVRGSEEMLPDQGFEIMFENSGLCKKGQTNIVFGTCNAYFTQFRRLRYWNNKVGRLSLKSNQHKNENSQIFGLGDNCCPNICYFSTFLHLISKF